MLFFKIVNCRNLCQCLRNSLEGIFSDVFIVASVFSWTPIVCACFVVAWWSVIPRTSIFSCITFATKTEPLSVIITLGKYASLVIMSLRNFAALMVVAKGTGYAKADLENTSVVVKMFLELPFDGISGIRSICMTSSGPKSHSSILMDSDVSCELSIFFCVGSSSDNLSPICERDSQLMKNNFSA